MEPSLVGDLEMKCVLAAVFSLAFLAGTAGAQEAPPAGALNDADLRALTGKRLTFQDAAGGSAGSAGVAEYRAKGAYLYSFGPNNYNGKWSVEGSRICASTGRRGKRCDWVTKEGENYFLINPQGNRYRFTIENL
jgi:hypothetical protein